jgi:hypothetical protein
MPSDCVAARRPMSRWRVGRHPVPCRSQQYFRGGKDHAHRAYYEEATLQLAAVTLAPIRAAGTHDGVAEELLKHYSVYCSRECKANQQRGTRKNERRVTGYESDGAKEKGRRRKEYR